ncbi:MAG: FixH family protein [Bacteroidaceae bacterium]|nr:FixH family protein [Bacteroidaceae bacterium]
MEKQVKGLFFIMVVAAMALTSCNSNDDDGAPQIEIPGVTFDGDVDCCSAEEALQVYKFLQTVKIIPELSTVVDGQYNVFAYSKTGTFHVGYNDLYFVATKRLSGNYIKNFAICDLTPQMYMVRMDKYHSTPVSSGVTTFNDNYLAVKRGWISFLMGSSDMGSWTLSYAVSVLGSKANLEKTAFTVDALPEGQDWVKSFKLDNQTYYLSLVNPSDWTVGGNEIVAYVSQQSAQGTTPYGLAEKKFTIDIDPRMPDMGNHTSPDNRSLTRLGDGSYKGYINLTMTGQWRIHLTVRDAQGNIVAGGDNLDSGYSSLYWDVKI